MEYLVDLGVFVLLLSLALWGADRHLCLKDVEKDLKLYLGDLLVVRDSLEKGTCHSCRNLSVLSLKMLIRKHFTL